MCLVSGDMSSATEPTWCGTGEWQVTLPCRQRVGFLQTSNELVQNQMQGLLAVVSRPEQGRQAPMKPRVSKQSTRTGKDSVDRKRKILSV